MPSYSSSYGGGSTSNSSGNSFNIGSSQGSSTGQSQSVGGAGTAVLQTPQSEYALQLAQASAAYGNSMFGWAGQNYGAISGAANNGIDQYLAGSGASNQLANGVLNQYENTYLPENKQLANLASTYSSPSRVQANMGAAEANANQATNANWNNTKQTLQGYGINPSAGEYGELKNASNLAGGASEAGAGTQARQNTEATGRQLLGESTQLGATEPANALNAISQGVYGGAAGEVNTAQSNVNTGANLYNTATNWYNTAANANKLPSTGSFSSNASESSNQSQNTSQNRGASTNTSSSTKQPTDTNSYNSGKGYTPSNNSGGGYGGNYGGGGGGGGGYGGYRKGGLVGRRAYHSGGVVADGRVAPNIHAPAKSGFDAGGAVSMPMAGPTPFTGGDSGGAVTGVHGTTSPDPDFAQEVAMAAQRKRHYAGGGLVRRGMPPGAPPPPGPTPTGGPGDSGPAAPITGGFAGGGGVPIDHSMPRGHIGRPMPQHGYHMNGLPDASTGGDVPYEISPSHGHTTDDVVANLNAGEFVMPRRTVHHLGKKFFYDTIAKADKEMGLHPQPVGAEPLKKGSGADKARSAAEGQNFLNGGGI